MNIKKILVLLIFTVAIVGIIAPISASESSDSKNKMYSIESKKKTVKYNVKWDANGGKIGKKKTITTNVIKGKKIGKLPATPYRVGYIFTGWYTKKTGGTKISNNTKPSKPVTYQAQWKKSNKLFVGKYEGIIAQVEKKGCTLDVWERLNIKKGGNILMGVYEFREDGSYRYSEIVVKPNADSGKNVETTVYIEEGAYQVEQVLGEGKYIVHKDYQARGAKIKDVEKILSDPKTASSYKWSGKSSDSVTYDKKKDTLKIGGATFMPYVMGDPNCLMKELVGKWEFTTKLDGRFYLYRYTNYKDGKFELYIKDYAYEGYYHITNITGNIKVNCKGKMSKFLTLKNGTYAEVKFSITKHRFDVYDLSANPVHRYGYDVPVLLGKGNKGYVYIAKAKGSIYAYIQTTFTGGPFHKV